MDNAIVEKSIDFAVRIVNLCRYLQNEKSEHIISKQIMRSGTSIGANIAEAQCAQSNADFISKMCIARKEANETVYWLTLLFRTGFLKDYEFESLNADITELYKILSSIIITSRSKKNEK